VGSGYGRWHGRWVGGSVELSVTVDIYPWISPGTRTAVPRPCYLGLHDFLTVITPLMPIKKINMCHCYMVKRSLKEFRTHKYAIEYTHFLNLTRTCSLVAYYHVFLMSIPHLYSAVCSLHSAFYPYMISKTSLSKQQESLDLRTFHCRQQVARFCCCWRNATSPTRNWLQIGSSYLYFVYDFYNK